MLTDPDRETELLASSISLVAWPAPQDYYEAIQNTALNLKDPQLRAAGVTTDSLGLPRVISGGFASVYCLECSNGTSLAVRFFLHRLTDQAHRYQLISDFLATHDSRHMVAFSYEDKGVRVGSSWYPLVKMDWVDGETLDAYVARNLSDTASLAACAEQFWYMCEALGNLGIAHGDLQHGNIIVTEEKLILVDYDGMFVPAMAGMQSNELGHRNYQHVDRRAHHFGASLDNFSAWVIFTSLKALSIDPSLYGRLGAGHDCLLFRQSDFMNPLQSHAFFTLENHSNTEIRALASRLRSFLTMPLEQVPRLNDELGPLPVLKPVEKPGMPWDIDIISTLEPMNDATARAAIATENSTLSGVESAASEPQLQSFITDPVLTNEIPRSVGNTGRAFSNLFNLVIVFLFTHRFLYGLLMCIVISCSGTYFQATVSSCKGGTWFGDERTVWYQYVDKYGDKHFNRTHRMPAESFYRLHSGDKLIVHDDLSRPDSTYQGISANLQSRPSANWDQLIWGDLFDNIISLICLFIGCLIVEKMYRHWRLVRSGLVTEGTVLGLSSVLGKAGQAKNARRLTYEYEVDGQKMTGEQILSKFEAEQAQIGERVAVLYSPTNPRNSVVYKWAQFKVDNSSRP